MNLLNRASSVASFFSQVKRVMKLHQTMIIITRLPLII